MILSPAVELLIFYLRATRAGYGHRMISRTLLAWEAGDVIISARAWPDTVQRWAALHPTEWSTAGRVVGLHDRLAALLTSGLPEAAATVDVLLAALGRCDYDMDRETWALWWLVSGFEHLGPVIASSATAAGSRR